MSVAPRINDDNTITVYLPPTDLRFGQNDTRTERIAASELYDNSTVLRVVATSSKQRDDRSRWLEQ